MPAEIEAWIDEDNDPSVRCMLKLYWADVDSPDKGV